MEKVIIIINGKGGVGKDTLCDFARKAFKVRNISSITKVKEVAAIAGWDGEKDVRGRRLLSDIKNALIKYDDCIIARQLNNVTFNHMLFENIQILFVHIREPEEIEKYKSLLPDAFTVKTLLIKRDTGIRNYGNPADDLVENYDYDYTYENTKPLEEAGDDFINFLNETMGLKDLFKEDINEE